MKNAHHISILKAGIQTTVQNMGRTGLRHLGISQSGALDTHSLILANQLVGNDEQSAGLEVVIGPVHIRFETDTCFALTGADFNASLDNQRISPAWRIHAAAGQVLKLTGAQSEMRAYIAFAGGINVPPILGARATDIQAKFGGWQGRSLQIGDQIPIGTHDIDIHNEHINAASFGVMQRAWSPEIRVLLGAEFSQFTPASQQGFFSQAWRMSAQSNRMGARLQGQALERIDKTDLLSHAVMPGTVQVPPNGMPIVLLADSQTTGGYPRIAHVINADLWKLAQTRTGQQFCFIQTDRETALAAQKKWQSEEEKLAAEILRRIRKIHA